MMRLLGAALIMLVCGMHTANAIGFMWASAPDADNAPLQVAIFYPSPDPVATLTIGPFDMDVAEKGTVAPGHHPLIVMSHGTGGMALNSFDTAIAMAKAGFIVAAVTHNGDNYRDQSVSFTAANFINRPHQISHVLDYMLAGWSGHTAIDPKRIGAFGHSAGGFTVLALVGGRGDFALAEAFCRDNPEDWGCRKAREHGSVPQAADAGPILAADPRIKAAVVAAPALGVTFQPNGLSTVHVPVQLWLGAQDDIVRDAPLVHKLLPSAEYHLIPNAGHWIFLAPCSDMLAKAAPEICADPKGFNRVAFLARFQQSVIAFFKARLLGVSAKQS